MGRKKKPRQKQTKTGGRDAAPVGSPDGPLSRKERRELLARSRQLAREVSWLLRRHRSRLQPSVLWALADDARALRAHLERKGPERDLALLRRQTIALDQAFDAALGDVRKPSWRRYVESIAAALAVALFIRAFLFEAYRIPTGSMIPTLMVGDFIFVAKFTYGIDIPFTDIRFFDWRKPARGEIVIFEHPNARPGEEPGEILIKRIMAVPGDFVRMEDNVWFVNGEPQGTPRVLARRAPCILSPGESCWCGDLPYLESVQQDLRRGKDPPATDAPCTYMEETATIPQTGAKLSFTTQHHYGGFYRGHRDLLESGRGDAVAASESGIPFRCFCRPPDRSRDEVAPSVNFSSWPGDANRAIGGVLIGGLERFKRGWPGHDPFADHSRRLTDDQLEMHIPDGHVMVLGDNRDNSEDGRYWGLVPYLNIKGKAQFIWFAAFDRLGRVFHRVH